MTVSPVLRTAAMMVGSILPGRVAAVRFMPDSALPMTFREVLQIRPLRRLWLAQLVSVFGDFLAIFAVYSIVTFQFHGTPTQVSLILISYLAPLAVISPLAGVFVDKWNLKLTMVASDLIRGVLVIMLLFARDLNSIYVIFFAISVVSSFFIPAQSVAVRTIAPPAALMAVNALMSQAIQGTQIISPALAGLLVQGWEQIPAFFSTVSVSSSPRDW